MALPSRMRAPPRKSLQVPPASVVDADGKRRALLRPREVGQQDPRVVLVRDRDRVLEIHHHLVGAGGERLADLARIIGRDAQHGAAAGEVWGRHVLNLD